MSVIVSPGEIGLAVVIKGRFAGEEIRLRGREGGRPVLAVGPPRRSSCDSNPNAAKDWGIGGRDLWLRVFFVVFFCFFLCLHFVIFFSLVI